MLFLATVGACGEKGDAADRLAERLRTDAALADVHLTEDQTRCAAEHVVDDLGQERVVDAGLTDPDDGSPLASLPETDLAAVAGAVDRCVDDLDGILTSAIAEGILSQPDDALPVSKPQASCVAQSIFEGLGAPRLLVLGVAQDGSGIDLTATEDEDVDAVTTAFLDCLDIRQVFVDQFAAQGVPDDTAACLGREIPESSLRDLFTAQFAGDQVDPDALIGPALTACGLG